MDQNSVKKIVDENIEIYMKVMGVPHWRISVDYGPCQDPNHSADISRQTPYNLAEITIDPGGMKDEEDVLKTIVHELAHVVLAPFDLYRDLHVASCGKPGSVRNAEESAIWRFVIEQAVINVERMFRGMNNRAWDSSRRVPSESSQKSE